MPQRVDDVLADVARRGRGNGGCSHRVTPDGSEK
jgi:hypothetical protein